MATSVSFFIEAYQSKFHCDYVIEQFPLLTSKHIKITIIINDSIIIGNDALGFLFITIIGRKFIFAIGFYRVFTHPYWII